MNTIILELTDKRVEAFKLELVCNEIEFKAIGFFQLVTFINNNLN